MKKRFYKLTYLVMAGLMVIHCKLPVFAATSQKQTEEEIIEEITSPIDLFVNILLACLVGTGAIVFIKGLTDFFPAIAGHDISGVVKGVLEMIVGGCLVAITPIMKSLGYI